MMIMMTTTTTKYPPKASCSLITTGRPWARRLRGGSCRSMLLVMMTVMTTTTTRLLSSLSPVLSFSMGQHHRPLSLWRLRVLGPSLDSESSRPHHRVSREEGSPGFSLDSDGSNSRRRPSSGGLWLPSTTPRRPALGASAVLFLGATTGLASRCAAATAPTASLSSSSSGGGDNAELWTFFLQTLIANGVPTLMVAAVLVLIAVMFRPRRSSMYDSYPPPTQPGFGLGPGVTNNPLTALYTDLYGDQDPDGLQARPLGPGWRRLLGGGGMGARPGRLPRNVGVPAVQMLQITHVNRQLDSYRYSLTAATQSKAAAAAEYRRTAFARAMKQALPPPVSSSSSSGLMNPDPASTDSSSSSSSSSSSTALLLPAHVAMQLQREEFAFLQRGQVLVQELVQAQTQLAQIAVEEEMMAMGLKSVYQLDPVPTTSSTLLLPNATAAATPDPSPPDANEVATVTVNGLTSPSLSSGSIPAVPPRGGMMSTSAIKNDRLKAVAKLQRDLQQLELDFVRRLVRAVGPTQAAAVRAAILGNVAIRGAGSVLTYIMEERPLEAWLKATRDDDEAAATRMPRRVFVTRFPGDVQASQVAELREEVTGIVRHARPGDEAVVILQTGGGTVTGYGLAAAQLLRFKEAGLKLTVAVEQVAASGGYMMCCVGDRIIASPFAVLGSIGVISDIPNFYDRLKKEGIEFQTVTAGKFKRTLTPTKKVTTEDFKKTQEDLEDVFRLFRDFVKQNRPQLDIDKVATGETWFGTAALELNLCDEIKTADELLLEYVDQGFDVYEVDYKPPIETPFGKLTSTTSAPEFGEQSPGIIRQGIRWLVRRVMDEVRAEMTSMEPSPTDRFMARDNTADRTKAQSE